MVNLGWLFLGLLLGLGLAFLLRSTSLTFWNSSDEPEQAGAAQLAATLLKVHFEPVPVSEITIRERRFPFRMRADLQRTVDQFFGGQVTVKHFFGVRTEYSHVPPGLTDCILESVHNPSYSIPPEYEEIDIGDEHPLQVLKNGLWLLESDGVSFAVMLSPCGDYGRVTGMQFQVGVPNTAEGTQLAQQFFKLLEQAVARGESYRGKILSLEQAEHSYPANRMASRFTSCVMSKEKM